MLDFPESLRPNEKKSGEREDIREREARVGGEARVTEVTYNKLLSNRGRAFKSLPLEGEHRLVLLRREERRR